MLTYNQAKSMDYVISLDSGRTGKIHSTKKYGRKYAVIVAFRNATKPGPGYIAAPIVYEHHVSRYGIFEGLEPISSLND